MTLVPPQTRDAPQPGQAPERAPEKARVSIQPGFRWDRQQAYLFDIDGTLLRSRDRIHCNSFAEAARRAAGVEISLDGILLHGGTDTLILREALEMASIPAEVWEPRFEATLEAMRKIVAAERPKMSIDVMPAVPETLAHLRAQGAVLGVATGNLESIGWIKIEEAGLREWFRFGGFSDRYPIRAELVGHAARLARELAGPEASVCVVGDTPKDIAAARANGLPAIAVATGNYSFDELIEHQPEACAASLADLLRLAPSCAGEG